MDITRIDSRPSDKGPPEWFTGTVRLDPLFRAPDPARVAAASVTFEPGARTAWHVHPLGQHLVVIAGCGRAQRWGGPVETIRPGDVIWIAAGEKSAVARQDQQASFGETSPERPSAAKAGTGTAPGRPPR